MGSRVPELRKAIELAQRREVRAERFDGTGFSHEVAFGRVSIGQRWEGVRGDEAMRALSLFLALFGFWLLLSGYFETFLIVAGAGSAGAVVLLAHRMYVIDHEGHPIHLGIGALSYWPWLLVEIVKSAWDVTCIILNPRLPVSPVLVRVKTLQHTTEGVVTFANSITLTPGTISVDVGNGEILVHALTREGADSLNSGEMNRRVARFEGSA